MGYNEAFDISTATSGAGSAYGNVANSTTDKNRFRATAGYPIVLPDGSVYVAEIAYPATGGTGKSTAGGPAPDQVQRIFNNEVVNPTNVDTKLYTVTTGKAFYLTDLVVTTTAATGTVRVKARVATTQGATTAGAGTTITFPASAPSSLTGDAIYVGQIVYLEDPGNANYEAVAVSTVTRTGGIITGITCTTTHNHSANFTLAYPVYLASINSTKGIEVIGQETQPSVNGGWDLCVTYGAVTGTIMQNLAGFEQ